VPEIALTRWRSEWARLLCLARRDANKYLGPYRIPQTVGATVFIAIYLARIFHIAAMTDLWKLAVAGVMGWLTVYSLTFLWRLTVIIPKLTRKHPIEQSPEALATIRLAEAQEQANSLEHQKQVSDRMRRMMDDLHKGKSTILR